MNTVYVILSYDSSNVEAVAAFSNELDAQAEIIRLMNKNEKAKWYNHVSVEWRG